MSHWCLVGMHILTCTIPLYKILENANKTVVTSLVNPSTLEAETGGYQVPGQLGLYTKTLFQNK
jgi:hypothetical protein